MPARWFDVWGADDDDELVGALRQEAESRPRLQELTPLHTGGWLREGLIITYADVSSRAANAVVTSFRADFDGQRVLAAEIAPGHVDQGRFFDTVKPVGEPALAIAAGDAVRCAYATAAWFRDRLFSR